MSHLFDREPTGPLAGARPAAPAGAPGILAEGAILADRFRIVALLGHGGMGEVYEAEDMELGERVALKTLRAEHAGDEEAIEGFRREIQLARKVTHVSVCRTYDLFRHRGPGPDGTPLELAFVSMELLRGDTVLERLRRDGRFTTDAALPIVTQVAAGLAAAHRAGVVHRDLKSANVSLVSEEDGRVRAVVTDFGLAHEPARELRGEGDDEWIVGTPTYMAPEQVAGKETGPATDIYALGVMMYEMVTGAVPFPGATPMASAMKRLSEPPVPPRVHLPDLDARWDAAIGRCLERDPADRFASAEDLRRALTGGRVAPGRRQRRRRALFAGVALLAMAVAGAAALLSRRPGVGDALRLTPVALRRSVAALGFTNAGAPEGDWLATLLGEMVATELRASRELRAVSSETVARARVERGVAATDATARASLAAALGADLAVSGSFEAKDGATRVELRAEDGKSGALVAAATASGPDREIVETVAKAAATLRRGLGLAAPAPEQEAALAAARLANAEAARFYGEGLAERRVFAARSAKDLLTRAVAADPSSPFAHAALGDAWFALGYDERAREEARRARDLAGNLPAEERLRIEARFHEAARDWGQALPVLRKLREGWPDEVEYGLELAEVQASAGLAQDALATAAALARLPAPAGRDPRIAMAESRAALVAGDFQRAAAAAERAASTASAEGSRLLLARARLLESAALRPAGALERAVAANAEAKRLFAEVGDRGGIAQALRQTADIRRYQGRLEEARAGAEEGLKLARAAGDQRYTAWALGRIGSVLQEEGRLKEARQHFEEARAIAPETGDREAEATALNNIGVTLWQAGDLGAARRNIEGCLMFFRQLGQKRGTAFGDFNLGFVLLDQGDLAAAQRAFDESLRLSREAAEPSLEAMALQGLGNIALARAELGEARQKHEAALALRRGLGEKGRAAESLLALAAVAFEDGRGADADAAAREALGDFQALGSPHGEAQAQALLAELMLARGDRAGAAFAAERARARAAASEYQQPRWSAALVAARLAAATGKANEALQGLQELLAQAEDSGHAAFSFKARLARAEIEKAAGGASANGPLEALEKDAAGRGFVLVARRAKGLMR